VRCREWRDFSIIECRHASIRHADHHIAATAEVSGLRECHGQGEPCRDGSIHRISALLQDLGANFSSESIVTRYNRVFRKCGL
jgi:hypothetical protein